jgi:hypothetical protein
MSMMNDRTLAIQVSLPAHFLAGLLTSAVEGAMTPHWLSASSITRHDASRPEPGMDGVSSGFVIRVLDPRNLEESDARFDPKEFVRGFNPNQDSINLGTIYRGLQRLFEPGVLPGRRDLRGKVVSFSGGTASPDALDWDSVDADVILQLGFFGQVVFG